VYASATKGVDLTGLTLDNRTHMGEAIKDINLSFDTIIHVQ